MPDAMRRAVPLDECEALPCPTPLDAIGDRDLTRRLLRALTERELMVVAFYYGLAGPAQRLEDIGRREGVSRERIREIRVRAEGKMRRRARALGFRAEVGKPKRRWEWKPPADPAPRPFDEGRVRCFGCAHLQRDLDFPTPACGWCTRHGGLVPRDMRCDDYRRHEPNREARMPTS